MIQETFVLHKPLNVLNHEWPILKTVLPGIERYWLQGLVFWKMIGDHGVIGWLQKEGNWSSGAPDSEDSMDGGLDTVGSHFGEDRAKVNNKGVLARNNVKPWAVFLLNLCSCGLWLVNKGHYWEKYFYFFVWRLSSSKDWKVSLVYREIVVYWKPLCSWRFWGHI